MKGKIKWQKFQRYKQRGRYSLCDTVARANKGHTVNNGQIPSGSTKDLCPVTITPKVDGYIFIIVITSGTWGYDGVLSELHTTCNSDSSLPNLAYMDGQTGSGGNQIGRQMTQMSLWDLM